MKEFCIFIRYMIEIVAKEERAWTNIQFSNDVDVTLLHCYNK